MDMSNGGRITDAGARTGHTHPADEVDAIPLSSLNVKGDIIIATGNDAYYVLPVGADGTALVASSGTTPGVAWAAPAPKAHTHTQAESHYSADTNNATTSLHHTLGTGALQAAAGNHGHADIVPIGAIFPYAGTTAPANYLICDGSVVSSTAYPTLAAICGSNYGPATASTFTLPNLQARVPFGYSGGTAQFNTVGKTGGALSVTLLTENLPSHTHTTPAHSHTTQAHTHTVTAHTHSIPNHAHTQTVDTAGGHTHGTTATTTSGGDHQHDTRVNDGTNFVRTGSANGAVWSGINTANLTAQAGGHTHSVSVSEPSAGGHTHTITQSQSGGGTSGSGNDTLASATTTVDSGGSGTSGSTGTGTAVTTLPPYVALNYIIKAL